MLSSEITECWSEDCAILFLGNVDGISKEKDKRFIISKPVGILLQYWGKCRYEEIGELRIRVKDINRGPVAALPESIN